MTTLSEDPSIVDDAIARLTDVFRDQRVVRALTETLAERFAVEDAVDLDVYSSQWIDSATGELLDALGEIVGESRQGRADDIYRLWIRARIYINRSHGRITDSYHLVRLIAGVNTRVKYTPAYPAGYMIEIDNLGDDATVFEVNRLLEEVRPGGVQMNLVWTPDDDADYFTLAPGSTLVSGDADKGLGDHTDPSVGGRLRGIV